MHDIGRLVLNKNPENYHRDIEQLAFSPGSFVPGIEASPDALLQFRTFLYRDAQYHRLGVNLHQILVNCPFMAKSYSSINFDRPLRIDANTAGNPHWVPNSYVDKFRPDCTKAPYQVSDNIVSRQGHYLHEGEKSEYDQARVLYTRVMTEQEKLNTHDNTAVLLKFARPETQVRYLGQCYTIHQEYARGIFEKLTDKKFSWEEVEKVGNVAEKLGKEPRFMPSEGYHKLVGKYPTLETYTVSPSV